MQQFATRKKKHKGTGGQPTTLTETDVGLETQSVKDLQEELTRAIKKAATLQEVLQEQYEDRYRGGCRCG